MQRINTPDGQFHAGDPSTGALGTIVTRDYMQSLQEEIAGFIEGAGLPLNPNDNGQLGAALTARLQRALPLIDTGAVNAYAATNLVPLTVKTLVHGVRQRVTIGTTNNGASTYSPDGLPLKPIIGQGLQPLQGLELLATLVADLEYIVSPAVNEGRGAWLLLGCGGGAQQLGAGSYGVTSPRFDKSKQLATMEAVFQWLGNYQPIQGISADVVLTTANFGQIWQANTGDAGGRTISFPLAQGNAGKFVGIVNTSNGVYKLKAVNINCAYGSGPSVDMPSNSTGMFVSDGTSYNAIGGSAAFGVGVRPQPGSGVGQWQSVLISSGIGGSIWLPPGGTWAYFYFNQSATQGSAGIAAGGTTLLTGNGAGGPGISQAAGLCWRI